MPPKRASKRGRPASLDESPSVNKPSKLRARKSACENLDANSTVESKKSPYFSRQDATTSSGPRTEQSSHCRPGIVAADGDILGQIYQAKMTQKRQAPAPNVCSPLAHRSINLLHYWNQVSMGITCRQQLRHSVQSPVRGMLAEMQLYRTASPFDRRCTALEWHPRHPHMLAVASKAGDIILWNHHTAKDEHFISGKGPGGSVGAMKFKDDLHLVTAALDGTVTCQDFEGRHTEIWQDTGNFYDYWYTSLDINHQRQLVVAGGNTGLVSLLSMEGRKLWEFRLHKSKVSHAEFSPKEDWLLCTASVDQTVQVWDVRMVKDRKSVLYVLKHEKPVNSAYFSLTDGTRLLTTDQHHEIRVYRTPDFRLERTIEHPHRFFQHITPIKAYWHPLQDIVVIGRYPDEKSPDHVAGEKRTIDMFDAESGDMICQLYDSGVRGLISLNKFNNTGDCLASAMGLNILLWSRQEEVARRQEALIKQIKQQGSTSSELPVSRSGSRQSSGQSKRAKTKDKTDSKLKEKAKTKLRVKTKENKK